MAGLGHWYIEISKQSYWRGNQHVWVNRYIMSGSDPSASDATAVIGILKGIENQLHAQTAGAIGVGFVQGRAYKSTGGTPFATVNYNVALTPTSATGFAGPTYTGHTMTDAPTIETCLLIETQLNGLNSRGKPIFLRKYMRGVSFTGESDAAAGGISTADKTGIAALVAPWWTGMGTNNWVVIGTSGKQAAAAPYVAPFLVTHQVPRGRKRKVASSSSGLLGDVERALANAGSDAVLAAG